MTASPIAITSPKPFVLRFSPTSRPSNNGPNPSNAPSSRRHLLRSLPNPCSMPTRSPLPLHHEVHKLPIPSHLRFIPHLRFILRLRPFPRLLMPSTPSIHPASPSPTPPPHNDARKQPPPSRLSLPLGPFRSPRFRPLTTPISHPAFPLAMTSTAHLSKPPPLRPIPRCKPSSTINSPPIRSDNITHSTPLQ